MIRTDDAQKNLAKIFLYISQHWPQHNMTLQKGSEGGEQSVATWTALVGSLMVAGSVMRERSLPMAFLRTLQIEKPRCKGLGAGSLVLAFASFQLSRLLVCKTPQLH